MKKNRIIDQDDYLYMRIQGRNIVRNTLTGKGVFGISNELLRKEVMEKEDAELYMEIDDWFVHNLPFPEQCKKQEKVICFFKTENSEEMLKWMKPVLWLFDRYNVPYFVVYTNNPGKIVYEDKYQIAVDVSDVIIEPVPESWSKDV